MPQTLNHPYSPLEQARRQMNVALADDFRQLSARDQATLKRILTSKCDFVPNPLFSKADAPRKIFDDPEPIARPDTSWYHPVMENAVDARAVNHSGTVLLTAAEERTLFLQFNYCRYKVAELRKKIGDGAVDPDVAHEILEWHEKAEAYRDQIAQTNLALVLAMAKRTRMSEVDFSDLVSEGNMALLRAVDKFDAARGFKFSTYACRAILKAFSRAGVKHSKYRSIFPTDFDPKLEKSDYMEKKREGHEDDCVDEIRQIIKDNRADLSDIEQEVIQHRFALGRKPVTSDSGPLTLEQVGKIIGVTKERVRQIQNKALEKIRVTLEGDFLG
jgi:RNA polymerase sigma factor (sigma-70 family)